MEYSKALASVGLNTTSCYLIKGIGLRKVLINFYFRGEKRRSSEGILQWVIFAFKCIINRVSGSSI